MLLGARCWKDAANVAGRPGLDLLSSKRMDQGGSQRWRVEVQLVVLIAFIALGVWTDLLQEWWKSVCNELRLKLLQVQVLSLRFIFLCLST